jgi:hypothetical protein
MVLSQSVRFGLVPVVFLVAPTGPANTSWRYGGGGGGGESRTISLSV